jgi:hypothetical protein
MRHSRTSSRLSLVTLTGLSGLLLVISVAGAVDDFPGKAAGDQEICYDRSEYDAVNHGNGNLTFRVPRGFSKEG